MNDNEPIAFFITWTVYGTFLQGDERGWRRRMNGYQASQPRLATWRRERLKHTIKLLSHAQQSAIDAEIERLAAFRGWYVWTTSARTNHVHTVISANGYAGNVVRDQLKANCTRVLRERWPVFIDRPVWTIGGDWECINSERDLEQLVAYVSEAQDRMRFDDRKRRTGR